MGIFPPRVVYFFGFLRNSTISRSSSAATSTPAPAWKHTFTTVWQSPWDTWQFIGGWRYVGEVKEHNAPNGGFIAKGEHYIDLSASYSTAWFGGEETLINVGVSNLLDNDPPVSGLFGNVAVFGNGNTIPSTWDALGRYYFVALTQRF